MRRRSRRRSIAISSASTLVVIGGLITLLVTSPGWHTVRTTFFSFNEFRHSIGQVSSGFWLDVRMFLVVEVVVLALGLLIALCRTVKAPALFPLRLLAIAWADLFRGVPTILVVYIVGFGVPALDLTGLPTGAVVLGGAALAMCYSAYVSEVFRAGIESIHPSQAGAALALGLTPAQALRHVVLPQAIRRVLPPLLNDFIALQKDVALVSIIGPQEAFRVAQIFAAENFNYTPLISAALLYLCVTIPLTRIVDRLQARSLRERGAELALGAEMTTVLEARGVTKAYGRHEVLRGIDLELREHQAVALIGASGSGKSTLLRCIDLLEEIDDGDIMLDGEPITVPGMNPVPIRRRLGLVFQAYNLFPHRNVIENVIMGAVRAQGMARDDARAAGLGLLERFGLGDRGDDYPDRLSGGQQQRVAIARALLTRPRALLLDEVTSALDPELVGEVLGVIRELKQEGMTMLIATHEMSFAREVADQVCYLQDGRIVERGSPEQIFTDPAHADTQRFLSRLLAANRL